MTSGVECVGENQTLADAARMMRDLDVGALPICGEDNRLKGMLTDRDIVVRCVADGGDPMTTASDFNLGDRGCSTFDAQSDHAHVRSIGVAPKLHPLTC